VKQGKLSAEAAPLKIPYTSDWNLLQHTQGDCTYPKKSPYLDGSPDSAKVHGINRLPRLPEVEVVFNRSDRDGGKGRSSDVADAQIL